VPPEQWGVVEDDDEVSQASALDGGRSAAAGGGGGDGVDSSAAMLSPHRTPASAVAPSSADSPLAFDPRRFAVAAPPPLGQNPDHRLLLAVNAVKKRDYAAERERRLANSGGILPNNNNKRKPPVPDIDGPFLCEHCDREFQNQRAYNVHFTRIHGQTISRRR
jgi:hypothetical protein